VETSDQNVIGTALKIFQKAMLNSERLRPLRRVLAFSELYPAKRNHSFHPSLAGQAWNGLSQIFSASWRVSSPMPHVILV
jgi:hypothetical protein